MKLPYETINFYAFFLIDLAALSDTDDEAIMHWDSYLSYLESCGWSDQEFDVETLKKIDSNWDLYLLLN